MEQQNEFGWRPLYPNNMKCNGLEGYYCVCLRQHSDGTVSARKYSIVFQREEKEPGSGWIEQKTVTHYILFEKLYSNVIGPLSHPEPSDEIRLLANDHDTFNACDVNDKGSFVYAYHDLETAKKRAETQWNHIAVLMAQFL